MSGGTGLVGLVMAGPTFPIKCLSLFKNGQGKAELSTNHMVTAEYLCAVNDLDRILLMHTIHGSLYKNKLGLFTSLRTFSSGSQLVRSALCLHSTVQSVDLRILRNIVGITCSAFGQRSLIYPVPFWTWKLHSLPFTLSRLIGHVLEKVRW